MVQMKKLIEKQQLAIDMRKKGLFITTISKNLNVAKSSVSTWVRNVKTPPDYKDKLQSLNRDKIKQCRIKRKIFDRNIIKVGSNFYIQCSSCKQSLKLFNFCYKPSRGIYSTICNSCQAEYMNQRRIRAIEILGGRCECGCDCNDASILEIHHKKFNGRIERRELSHSGIITKILKMLPNDAKKEYEACCPISHSLKHIKYLDKFEINLKIKFKNYSARQLIPPPL